MMKKQRIVGPSTYFLLVAGLMALFQATSCERPAEQIKQPTEQINRMGPEEAADFVYFFKSGTTAKQIFEFQRTVAGIPNETGSGYSSLPGEMTSVAIRINGYDGEAIRFKPNATDEQKEFVRNRISRSDLIYKVYENVIPVRITDLNSSNSTMPQSTRKPSKVK